MPKEVKCRMAPSLGALEGTPMQAWGTGRYRWPRDAFRPTVFMGLYDLRDYLAVFLHPGKKWVLWCGSDVRNLDSGFAFNDGKLRWLSALMGNWWCRPLIGGAEHWTENTLERSVLEANGVRVSGVCPSFLGDVEAVRVNRADWSGKSGFHAWLSCGRGRQVEYGFREAETLASMLPGVTFHLFGDRYRSRLPNVVCHGRVGKSRMNEITSEYHLGLRLNHFDGFSEITAKALLAGQYAVTRVRFPDVASGATIDQIAAVIRRFAERKKPPDTALRNAYASLINSYPWNVNKYA